MPRFKLTIEYDGGRYKGWQLQKDQRTVQGEFHRVCREFFKTEQFEFYGAGRTDAGVHALGQVAHLDVKATLPLERIRIGINDLLPHDINVLQVEKAAPRFHARHDAVARSYVYQISRRRNAFGKPYLWWIKDSLDLPAMKRVASLMTGMQDFRSFSPSKNTDQESSLVKVEQLELIERGDMILVHIIGSHFLWKMVRRIVGVLVEAGRGNITEAQVQGFFREMSPEPALYTAPPAGLFLERIYFPGEPYEACHSLFQ